jgi:DNA-directed RNA polymerase delta subunit
VYLKLYLEENVHHLKIIHVRRTYFKKKKRLRKVTQIPFQQIRNRIENEIQRKQEEEDKNRI